MHAPFFNVPIRTTIIHITPKYLNNKGSNCFCEPAKCSVVVRFMQTCSFHWLKVGFSFFKTCTFLTIYWMIRSTGRYPARPCHHQHPFYMEHTVRYSRDIIFMSYHMQLDLSVEWDISCFCRRYSPHAYDCCHRWPISPMLCE